MRYRIKADSKLPISRHNGQLCIIEDMVKDSPYPYRVRLVGGPEGAKPLMLKMTELRPE